MCFGEADAGTIARAHGFAASDLGPSFEALRPLVGDGLCVIEGTRVTVRADARRFVRHVAARVRRLGDPARRSPAPSFGRDLNLKPRRPPAPSPARQRARIFIMSSSVTATQPAVGA